MNQTAHRFFEGIKGRRVSVVGVGVTNNGVIQLLCNKGAIVTVHDKRSREEIGGPLLDSFSALGATVITGERYLDNLTAEILFRAPGMYFQHPALVAFRERGGIVTSEMEVFFSLCPCKTIAITGSDGKTTTSTLIAKMLEAAGKRVHLGGNIGRALLPEIESIAESDIAVVELSSFQLLSMRERPDISVITNVAPNHLDVHGTMEEYIAAKKNIFLHQGAFGITVLNRDNEITNGFVPEVRGQLRQFSVQGPVPFGAYLREDGTLCLCENGRETPVMHRSDIAIPGFHNVANYLTAMAAVAGLVAPERMRRVAETFLGVEHRIELVRRRRGVRWYNDSIATSPTRTIAGLRSFDCPLILLAGGYDKKIPFQPLAPEINRAVKLLILTGPTAQKIEAAVREDRDFSSTRLTILHAENLEAAVHLAAEHACEGDVVSLSPACASFDCYPNFEARGRHFKALVTALEE